MFNYLKDLFNNNNNNNNNNFFKNLKLFEIIGAYESKIKRYKKSDNLRLSLIKRYLSELEILKPLIIKDFDSKIKFLENNPEINQKNSLKLKKLKYYKKIFQNSFKDKENQIFILMKLLKGKT